MNAKTSKDVLDFWFSDAMKGKRFKKDPKLDAEIVERFGATYEAAMAGRLDDWQETADGALALTITLDQFPRNMFRGSPRSFEGDIKARAVANAAIDAGHDMGVEEDRRNFFYMPLMHSEDLADQDRCVAIFDRQEQAEFLKYAIKHRDIVACFGRFPHRNAVLGRETTEDEAAFLVDNPGF